jgi:hypothetical protein
LVAAIRCGGGSAAGADCGVSESGWLALALAEVGGVRGAAGAAGAATGFGGVAVAGLAAAADCGAALSV